MQFTGIIFGPVVMKQGLVDSNGDGVRRNVTVITMHTASDLRHWHKWEYETDLTDTDAITKLIDHQLDAFEISEKEDKREVER